MVFAQVILNGQPIGDASHGITLKYLTESVCSAFTGSQEVASDQKLSFLAGIDPLTRRFAFLI